MIRRPAFHQINRPIGQIRILFQSESTEGVEVGQTTALGDNYAVSGSETPNGIVDYDNESLRSYDPPSAIPRDKAAHWQD